MHPNANKNQHVHMLFGFFVCPLYKIFSGKQFYSASLLNPLSF